MTTMACSKWKGLFSVGDEFDEEDLLESQWTSSREPTKPATSRTPVLQVSPAKSKQVFSYKSEAKASESLLTTSSGTVNPLQDPQCHQPPSVSVSSLRAPVSSQVHLSTASLSVPKRDPPAQDDFDDWDVDLEELDCIPQMLSDAHNNSASHLCNRSPAKRVRPCTSEVALATVSSVSALRPLTNMSRISSMQSCPSTPIQGRNHMLDPAAPMSHFPRPKTPRLPLVSPPLQRTPVQPRGSLFHSVSPASHCSSTFTPRTLNAPVLTNHLVQLVSAANKTPQRSQSRMTHTKTRRFPGPAGALPQQTSEKSLDDIVVSVLQSPAHGAVARLKTKQVTSSQISEEDEFSRGPWAEMKAEMGLDEKNSSCFLHSYSVVMVLRKAALRQLAKNKVPNMAVVLKSITHTHADAKAVFRDPTGEMHGTVHRRLVEDRQGELKTGAVLLLKQVGVFSPSHRNHYLNVTPNNLLRIYPPDGVFSQQPPLLELGLHREASRPPGGPISEMELHFNDEDEGGNTEEIQTVMLEKEAVSEESKTAAEAAWETDDLDELLGNLPVESYDGVD
ncbi:hypothetical protein DNTS_014928 [Danionella cerebrum]|uniref:Homologous recombination OB-fold protein OB-fold domain-containing protein n=1 Tax=Danionella cerebrum TaxID=2873325 RepID=A0A553Q2A6_9TELE|nr:hypothetical protein DNTS_014928 [Danionella translucida]